MVDIIVVFCNEHEWIEVDAADVIIKLDLQYDIVNYITKCPFCKKRIVMSRNVK